MWSETVRSPEHFHFMLFPRLLAVAERAWHKASWEDVQKADERTKLKQADWTEFATFISSRELKILENDNVQYRLSPPGAMLVTFLIFLEHYRVFGKCVLYTNMLGNVLCA